MFLSKLCHEITLTFISLLTVSLYACPGRWHSGLEDEIWSDFEDFDNTSFLYIRRPLYSWREAQLKCMEKNKDSDLAVPGAPAYSEGSTPWHKMLEALQEEFLGKYTIDAAWTKVKNSGGSWSADGESVSDDMWITSPYDPSNSASNSTDSSNSTSSSSERCAFLFVFSPQSDEAKSSSTPPAGLLDGSCKRRRAVLCQLYEG